MPSHAVSLAHALSLSCLRKGSNHALKQANSGNIFSNSNLNPASCCTVSTQTAAAFEREGDAKENARECRIVGSGGELPASCFSFITPCAFVCWFTCRSSSLRLSLSLCSELPTALQQQKPKPETNKTHAHLISRWNALACSLFLCCSSTSSLRARAV